MDIGLYVHIPFCLQKCRYCDFAVLPWNHAVGSQGYTQLILQELNSRRDAVPYRQVFSIYFGGGTPSLLDPMDILAIRREFANVGFVVPDDLEITIEINPGTIDLSKLDLYRAVGINRYSVGVQTFDDATFKALGREHTADASRKTLQFLIQHHLNFSFDLMFGLPNQTMETLSRDLDELLSYNPPHVSLYNLTIPKSHELSKNREPDDVQAAMFEFIAARLESAGIFRYEVSNFSLPGFESKHNQIYWTGGAYWGLGLSAHSYFPSTGSDGLRFWNPRTLDAYKNQVQATAAAHPTSFSAFLPSSQFELLKVHESLTDYFHTRLRTVTGFSPEEFSQRYPHIPWAFVAPRIRALLDSGLVQNNAGRLSLSKTGIPLADRVFYELTFTAEELNALPH